MKNHTFVRQWLILLVVSLFCSTQLLSFADVINPGMLTISAPGLFTAPQASSWGKASVSLYSTARSTRNNLPLQKLEDAKALDSAGVHTRKDFVITADGTVDCIVSHPASHEPLGFFELERTDSWARPFLREQDAADVKTVQAVVRGWSNNVRAAFDECDLVYVGHVAERNARFPSNVSTFYEQDFAPSAMYHMALREIAPSKAIYAFHHGREVKSSLYTVRNLWAVRRHRDPETNTQVLAWRSSLDKNIVIVAVAHAASDSLWSAFSN